MIILEDTRQQENRHNIKHDYFRSVGVHWNRTALYCGDYTLTANQSVCIDTKKDIAELIGDIQVKQMSKKEVSQKCIEIGNTFSIRLEIVTELYRAITDDDTNRFAEKEINDICFREIVPERAIAEFQSLYVKRHGFFHRGLKRAQNSEIKLYVLVENQDNVASVQDLFSWHNPRLDIWISSREVIGYYKNGKPRYRRVQKYPYAAIGQTVAKACLTMQLKYGVTFLFCKPEESGKKILELLGVENES